MNKNFDRKAPIFFVVSVDDEDPSKLQTIRRFGWKVDADRYKREQKKLTGERLFTISTVDWL